MKSTRGGVGGVENKAATARISANYKKRFTFSGDGVGSGGRGGGDEGGGGTGGGGDGGAELVRSRVAATTRRYGPTVAEGRTSGRWRSPEIGRTAGACRRFGRGSNCSGGT